MEFAFELATTKNSGRVYLFAASTAEDRRVWMTKLGKVLNCYFVFSVLLDYFVRSLLCFMVVYDHGYICCLWFKFRDGRFQSPPFHVHVTSQVAGVSVNKQYTLVPVSGW